MVTPRKAAACIIFRSAGEILMGRRSDSLRFMAGHHVFPGGRIDDDENTDHVRDFDEHDHAIRVKAAAREAFEETGLLLTGGTLPERDPIRKARENLLTERTTFDAILAEFNLHVVAKDFLPAGAWVTPEASPIRFDTRYYLYHHTGAQKEELITGELNALDWLSPEKARRRWHLGEIELSTPVAYTLRRMAASSFPAFLNLLQEPTNRLSGIPNDDELRRGIHATPLTTDTIPPATHTNTFIIGEEEILVIDPGSNDPNELAHLKQQIDHLLAMGAKLRAVVLTHGHRDHIGGIPFMQEHYNAPIWAHEETAARVDFEIDRHIQDEEILELPGNPGWRLRALHTPGHDPGHLSFYEESTRVIICGDMIANPGTIVVAEAGGGNMQQFLDSLKRLQQFEDATLLVPAHGMPDDNPVAKLQEHIDHRLWREAKIKEKYDAGAHTTADLLAASYDDAPKEAWPLAEHAMKAHLTRLGITLEN